MRIIECRIICPSIKCLIAIMDWICININSIYICKCLCWPAQQQKMWTISNLNSAAFFSVTHTQMYNNISESSLPLPCALAWHWLNFLLSNRAACLLLAVFFFCTLAAARMIHIERLSEHQKHSENAYDSPSTHSSEWWILFCYDAIEDLTLFTLCVCVRAPLNFPSGKATAPHKQYEFQKFVYAKPTDTMTGQYLCHCARCCLWQEPILICFSRR